MLRLETFSFQTWVFSKPMPLFGSSKSNIFCHKSEIEINHSVNRCKEVILLLCGCTTCISCEEEIQKVTIFLGYRNLNTNEKAHYYLCRLAFYSISFAAISLIRSAVPHTAGKFKIVQLTIDAACVL